MDINLIFRFCVLALLLILGVLAWVYRKRVQEMEEIIRRREEGWSALSIRLIIAIPLLIVLLLNIFYPRALYWSKIDLHRSLKMVSMVAAILCVPLIWWVLSSIRNFISETSQTEEDHLEISSGPYRLVRHPLYASFLLFLVSISLVLGDWIIFGYSVVGIIVFRLMVIPEEENQLLDTFGEDYECYQSKTGALFPWIR
jgi:protein-S-isoprenylcysteine O-methyltransferase Ste14